MQKTFVLPLIYKISQLYGFFMKVVKILLVVLYLLSMFACQESKNEMTADEVMQQLKKTKCGECTK